MKTPVSRTNMLSWKGILIWTYFIFKSIHHTILMRSIINFTDIYPSNHIDVHKNVSNRKYNWHRDARSYFYPHYTYFFMSCAILYYPLLCAGIAFMRNRSPFVLRIPLVVWNILLSFVSGYGAFHIAYYVYNSKRSTHDLVCNHEETYTSEIAWIVALFNATKILEWGDTIFLVLKKRKIIFLHWFHHLLTFLYCWHATMYSTRSDSSGLWFAGMNLFVHWIMYLYYGLAAMKIRLPFSWIITVIQTVQMVIGCSVLAYSPWCRDSWKNNWHGNILAGIMYSIYLYLFAQLLQRKVSSKKAQ